MMDTYSQPVTPKAAVPDVGGKARDSRRSVGEGGVGSESGAGARGQRQPDFQLAQAVSGRATGGGGAIKLLPVSVSENSPSLMTSPSGERSGSTSLSGTIQIELYHAQVRIEGSADPVLLRVLLECLRA
jgi:hypothetical protein